jgi:hypothetical protein
MKSWQNTPLFKAGMNAEVATLRRVDDHVKIRCRLEKIDKTGNSRFKKAVFHCCKRRLMNNTKR